jgi:hypothetical protein
LPDARHRYGIETLLRVEQLDHHAFIAAASAGRDHGAHRARAQRALRVVSTDRAGGQGK